MFSLKPSKCRAPLGTMVGSNVVGTVSGRTGGVCRVDLGFDTVGWCSR